jgi:hypothetical protein
VRNANREIGERAVMDNRVEVLLVDFGDNVKGMTGNLLYRERSMVDYTEGCRRTDHSETWTQLQIHQTWSSSRIVNCGHELGSSVGDIVGPCPGPLDWHCGSWRARMV